MSDLKETKEPSFYDQLHMPIETLISFLEKKFLPIDPDDNDLDINSLVIRKLKQFRLKNKEKDDLIKRINVLIGNIDPNNPDDTEDYGNSDSGEDDSDDDCLCDENFRSFDCIQNELDGGDPCKYHSNEDEDDD
jgi:hypothetical protein